MPHASPKRPRKIRSVGLIMKPEPARAAATLRRLCRWLDHKRLDYTLDSQTAALRGGGGERRDRLAAACDLIIVIGGDGTLLSVARDIGASRTPILGVNLGSLGFLTEVPLTEITGALEGILAGRYRIQKRMRLQAEIVRDGQVIAHHELLNEVVLNKSALARVLDIHVEVNARSMTTFRADGLIVSTPTGSTAYSLSAGGPIVDPSMDAIILCPICPHTLTNRPVVAPDTSKVSLSLVGNHGDVYVTIDGQVGSPFLPGDTIEIAKSRHPVHLIRLPGKDYFEVLRQKLKWGGRVPSGRAGGPRNTGGRTVRG